MRKPLVLVLLAVTVVALLLYRDDDARVAPSDASDEQETRAPTTLLTAVAEPGLEPLPAEKRARLKPKTKPKPLPTPAQQLLARVTFRGKPVAGRSVRISGTQLDPVKTLIYEAQTDKRGELRYALPRGLYKIGLVQAPSARFPMRDSMKYPRDLLTHRQPPSEPVLFVIPPGIVRVRVTSPGGQPIEGAGVSIGMHTAFTDHEGRAVLSAFRPGEAPVRVWKEGFAAVDTLAESVTVHADRDTHVERTLAPAGTLVLRFVNEDDREFFAPQQTRPQVTRLGASPVELPPPPAFSRRSVTTRDLLGTVTKSGLQLKATVDYGNVIPGRYRIALADKRNDKSGRSAIWSQPFEPIAPREIEVIAGRTTTVEMATRLRARVSLHVQDANGKPLKRGVSVWVRSRNDKEGASTLHLESPTTQPVIWGSCRFEGWLPPGTYEVELQRGKTVERHELVVAREPITTGYRPR